MLTQILAVDPCSISKIEESKPITIPNNEETMITDVLSMGQV